MRRTDRPAPLPKRSLPLSRVYRLLEPGPVVLVTTEDRGRPNVMPMSWYTMMEFEPPLLGCVLSGRNHSFAALARTGECALNIPTVELARQVVRCGNTSGAKTDKFEAFGLTPVRAATIAPPLVAECFANLECRVVDTTLVGAYNFFVLQVIKAWVSGAVESPRTLHHAGRGVFRVAGETIRLPSRKK